MVPEPVILKSTTFFMSIIHLFPFHAVAAPAAIIFPSTLNVQLLQPENSRGLLMWYVDRAGMTIVPPLLQDLVAASIAGVSSLAPPAGGVHCAAFCTPVAGVASMCNPADPPKHEFTRRNIIRIMMNKEVN